MHGLPAVSLSGACWHLPLADPTAGALLAALLADSAEETTGLLRTAVAQDPALLLWCVLRAQPERRDHFRSIAAVAQWLAERLPDELAWTSEFSCTWDVSRHARWAGLAESSLQTAHLAEALARQASADPDQAFFLGLLHHAPDWLAATGPAFEPARHDPARSVPWGAGNHSNPVPPEHDTADAVSAPAQPKLAASAAGCVRQAVELLAGGKPVSADLDRLRKASARTAAAARKRWLASDRYAPLLPRLAERLRRLDELDRSFQDRLEAEKLESMAEFAAGAGHEINNPLAVISGRAQLLLPEETNPERRCDLATIHAQALRVHEMIADMMLFARPPAPQFKEIDLAALVREVLGSIAARAEERGVSLEFRATGEPLLLQADWQQLVVALRAMCDNSLHAIGREGRIEIVADRAETGQLRLTVRDTGPGISPEVRKHLFDPYYSGRSAGRGLGLGLSKCWRIVTNHGGQIAVSGRADGAEFILTLPGLPAPSPTALR
jgi:signal transduction histidine kinase